MKRIGAIFFLVCFLAANSGIAIATHWCGGKLTAISFVSKHKGCACGKKKRAMKSGCCKDRITTLKAKEDLSTLDTRVFKNPILKEVLVLYPYTFIGPVYSMQCSVSTLYHPPPNTLKLPCYLFNRVILI